MPMPPGFEWIAALPPGLQMLVMLGVGIGFVLLGRSGYVAGKREPPVPPKDVVLTAASITDMTAVKDLATGVTRLAMAQERVAEESSRCADELGTIRQILAEDAENRQEDRTLRRGIEIGRKEPARRGR
nr:hypothetical protein [Methylobacterium sp. ZNC0032]